MFSSISPGKQGNVGKADCSDLCQLWVSIKSKCACQQFLHRSFTASSLLGIEKENHLPISNFDLSLSISHPNTRTSLLCSQRSCHFINLFALDTHLKFVSSSSLCVLMSVHIVHPFYQVEGIFVFKIWRVFVPTPSSLAESGPWNINPCAYFVF